MEKENKELTQEEAAKLLIDGEDVMSGGLVYRIVEGILNRIDSNDHATPIGADVETFTRMHHCYLPRNYYFSIFDLEDGVEYYGENDEAIYRRRENQIEYQTTSGQWKNACFHAGIPKFCPVVEVEYEPEEWLTIDKLKEILSIIKEVATKKFTDPSTWKWTKNPMCKYIQLRIDMRDGGFVLLDRTGKRISIEELKKQR